jgi:hypothetical protein
MQLADLMAKALVEAVHWRLIQIASGAKEQIK